MSDQAAHLCEVACMVFHTKSFYEALSVFDAISKHRILQVPHYFVEKNSELIVSRNLFTDKRHSLDLELVWLKILVASLESLGIIAIFVMITYYYQ